MSSWSTRRTASRTRSTPSPLLSAARSSDRSDWSRAIGLSPWGAFFQEHTEDHPMAHLRGGPSGRLKSPPLDGTPTSYAGSTAPFLLILMNPHQFFFAGSGSA